MPDATTKRNLRDGKPAAQTAVRSHGEVARIMTGRGYKMSRTRVMQIERRAIAKIRAQFPELAEVLE